MRAVLQSGRGLSRRLRRLSSKCMAEGGAQSLKLRLEWQLQGSGTRSGTYGFAPRRSKLGATANMHIVSGDPRTGTSASLVDRVGTVV